MSSSASRLLSAYSCLFIFPLTYTVTLWVSASVAPAKAKAALERINASLTERGRRQTLEMDKRSRGSPSRLPIGALHFKVQTSGFPHNQIN